ncbi:MAG: hypothetical protein KKD69_00935 [Euryarchaeota archaeon]|nr:hypothetical protein [Euryarchaeota archaeon]MCG2727386.1 hypothetical protein [Candidatus Methanoperedenaceae archaeon]
MATLKLKVKPRLQAAPPPGSGRSPAHFVVERGLAVLAAVVMAVRACWHSLFSALST